MTTKINYAPGLLLVDENGVDYVVTFVTTRVVGIKRVVSGVSEPATIRAFCDCKYRVKRTA